MFYNLSYSPMHSNVKIRLKKIIRLTVALQSNLGFVYGRSDYMKAVTPIIQNDHLVKIRMAKEKENILPKQ